jgi:hypothetical protein
MAISWAQGLLAGAAGVAEYSQQEQGRRQQRIDRTEELRNNMRMTHAKSAYASRVKEYEGNRKSLSNLEGVEAGSLAEQISLHKDLGFSEEAAFAASEQAMRAGKPLKRPRAMKLPEFEMPSITQRQASSPLQDWVRGFRQSYDETPAVDEAPQELEVQTSGPNTSFEPGVNPNPEDFGTMETTGSQPVEAVGGISAQDQATFDAMKPVVKPEKPIITKQASVRDGRGGQLVSVTDPTTLETSSTFIPSGISGMVSVDPIKVENEDGSITMTERVFNPETDEIYDTNIFTLQSADPEAPVEPVNLATIKEYQNPGSEDKGIPQGQFYADFPETERDRWTNSDKDSIIFTEAPEGFEGSMAGAMLEMSQAGYKKLKGKHMTPNNLAAIKQAWKAQAYMKVLGAEGVKQWIDDGAINKEIFFGRSVNRLPSVKALHELLGITKLSDPETFSTLTAQPTYNF